jgi:hypothetical protein
MNSHGRRTRIGKTDGLTLTQAVCVPACVVVDIDVVAAKGGLVVAHGGDTAGFCTGLYAIVIGDGPLLPMESRTCR